MKKMICSVFNLSYKDYSTAYAIFLIINYLLMLLLIAAWLYPIMNVVSASLSESKYVITGEVGFWPKGLDFRSYRMVWQTDALRIGLLNSIFYATVGCVTSVFLIALTAYPLSKKRLVFRSTFIIILAVTMFFGGGLIPTFLLVNKLGLYNTRAWIIMSAFFAPWHIIMMRTFFQNIPQELEESAQLDGYNDLQILLKIYIPLSTPVIATISLFTIVGFWNQYFVALVYLIDSSKMPIQVALRDLMLKGGDYGMFMKFVGEEFAGFDYQMYVEKMKYTAIVLTMVPMVVLFLSLQKYFVKGVLVGSIKG